VSWKIWKKPEERMKEEWDKAVSLRNQGKWRDASEHFVKAANLTEEVPGPQSARQGQIARALAALYTAVDVRTPESFLACQNAMARLGPETTLEIPNKVNAVEIEQEAKVFAEEARLPQVNLRNIGDIPSETADKFESLAQLYLSIGREKLALGDLFKLDGTSYRMAFKFLGFSKLLKGFAEEERDPSKAVEYYAEAIGNFGQAMLEEYTSFLDERNRKLGNVAKCWFCGRDVQGEEIHYVYMDTLLTPYLRDKFGGESPSSVKETKIAACVACYEAIHILADIVARKYYEMAMAELREVEQKLTGAIVALERRLSAVERVAHRHTD
jgi:tetratricopeptide (TPR) repeat protein